MPAINIHSELQRMPHFSLQRRWCSLTINMVLGLPANCYILWLSVKEMIQGQSTEIFVFNATLVESVFCISYVFLIRQILFICSDCEFGSLFFGLVLWVGQPLFQSCICVERYVGVQHPVTFLKFKPMKYRIACSAVGWVLIIISCITYTLEVITLYNLLLLEFIFFFAVKVFCCLTVLKALGRPRPGDDVKRRDGVNKDKIKAFRITLMVLVCSVIMYGPNIISLVLYYIIEQEKFLLSWSISLSLGIMLGFGQPFLYLKIVGKLPFC